MTAAVAHTTPAALWWFASLALLLVAALAYALGVWRERSKAQTSSQMQAVTLALAQAQASTAPAADVAQASTRKGATAGATTSATTSESTSETTSESTSANTSAASPAPTASAPALVLAATAAAAASNPETSDADAFSFTLSHDLRAPIRVVEGFTRIVKEDYGHLLDRVGNDHLDRVLGAGARMNLMIDALLTLARLSSQPLQRQPVNLSQLATYVMDDLRRAAPEREADIQIAPLLQAHGDPTLLRLVLDNLLGNAWKYSAGAPKAHISLTAVPHDTGKSSGLAFEVRDNGAGFDMRSADRLFGLFQRLHSASEFAGHGVGLASVRRIVQRHGGQVWAQSEPGRGAAFYFTLG